MRWPVTIRIVWRIGFWASLALFGSNYIESRASTTLTTYVPQLGTPTNIPNFVEPSAGCEWQGVGGQVFDLNRKPVNGLIVRVRGTIDGENIDQSAVTGSSLQFGPGGYEISFSGQPANAQGLRVRLLDVTGKSLSGNVSFSIVDDCKQNLTVINLVRTTFNHFQYIPFALQ